MSDAIHYVLDGTRTVTLHIREDIYPLDAIYGSAYLFIDRCFVFLDRPEDQVVSVRLRTKGENHQDKSQNILESLVGEFANELLNQVLRFRITESTSKIREYYMARAFVSVPAQTSLDALLAELDAEELEDDELEISVPWEQGPES
jgi:His-Xaa-Ser system protein HxsD